MRICWEYFMIIHLIIFSSIIIKSSFSGGLLGKFASVKPCHPCKLAFVKPRGLGLSIKSRPITMADNKKVDDDEETLCCDDSGSGNDECDPAVYINFASEDMIHRCLQLPAVANIGSGAS